ncbi:adenylyltransferase/cytidyltransferase family protein [Actinomadura xylanilytica]|uniref:adenylyltransferase/cytidyltransferase family protein n=1 Tax=Actinomadura xylanilytica TaxID=887459 RepID=UPI00255A7730|nr:adenylyltransferase/cytidyltransferase family protein [Actinomadura xylanilytica]MDL4772326.1 adenylyltransferase/cytidyltransferase family protein [Actinomadura xylanilytica]
MHGVVGFSPGVFDLFHVGHLDVLRRADASCDRLVAGILTDELAERLHGARPIVPLIERMEIVGDVRHVDRVVPLDEADLRGVMAGLGAATLFTGRPDALVPEAAERGLAGAGVRVVRFTGTTETASPVLRAALTRGGDSGSGGRAAGDERRSSVA